MTARFRPLLVGAMALASAGCSLLATRTYVPVHYYILELAPAGPDGAKAAAPARTGTRALAVARLASPPAYGDRIFYSGQDCTAGYFESDRWVEPPAEMLTRALEQSLRAGGAARAVARESLLRDADLLLAGELVRFDIVRNARDTEAVCEIQLVLRDLRSRTVVWAETFAARRPVRRPAMPVAGPKVHAMVEAMNAAASEVIARAAEAVSKVLAGLPDTPPAPAK
jgi:ABC-type uncharacterized transport system auxiliary subunit